MAKGKLLKFDKHFYSKLAELKEHYTILTT